MTTPAEASAPEPTPYVLSEFERFDLPRKVLAALILQDVETPTPVQAAVIPDAMAGHDVLGRAQTGSGKTLAFGIPIVARLAGEKSRIHRPRALVIVPTRELAAQVERSMELVARAVGLKLLTVYGGTRYDRQIEQLRRGTDIVVATPGRLQDLIDKGVLRTDDVAITVLDEADHLCDLGFYPAVDALLDLIPAEGQRMLLSATLDGDVDQLVRKHLRAPRRHEVDASSSTVTTMDHHVLVVGGFKEKIAATVALVRANERTIVFTRTRDGATELRDALAEQKVVAVDLHGNLSQHVRERNLERFSDGRARAVVATDVAARGIHVDRVGVVVHFDPPTDPKAYLHRSGRTARAGESGAVVTIATPRQVTAIVSMQRQAKVSARHHDFRSAPEELSAAALASSGTEAPADRKTRPHRPGSSRPPHRGRAGGPAKHGAKRSWDKDRDRSARATDKPGGRGTDQPAGRGTDKPAGRGADKPRSGGKPRTGRAGADAPAASTRRTGKKARWTQSDRDRRR
jgi:superfamily II DNA/RNA helicase